MTVLAIDPGPMESAYVLWNGTAVTEFGKLENEDMRLRCLIAKDWPGVDCAIEKIASYGMTVGAEVFETVFWTGRFTEAFGAERVFRIPRLEVKIHLCHDSRAKDANIRQALIDRLGAPGTKKHPGPTYGISGDVWAALAVAVRFWDAREFYLQTKGAA